MRHLKPPRRRRNRNFDINPIRRAEIIRHAIDVGAMDSDDRDRWLVAYALHNQSAKDQVWSVMRAAQKMGGEITRAEAIAIVDEANAIPRAWGADRLAKHMGVTYDQRQALGLKTIGSVNVTRAERKEIRKVRDKVKKQQKRRASGVIARAKYEAKSLSRTQPWRKEGVSRRTWERHQNKRDASVSAVCLVSTVDRLATPEGRARMEFERGFAPKEARGYPSSQTATTMAADGYESLPVQLRMAALCLPMPENLARAA
jgi:hypothetical protein